MCIELIAAVRCPIRQTTTKAVNPITRSDAAATGTEPIHHISDKVLYHLVLRSIQRLSSHIIADKCGFAEELKCKWEAQANGKPQKQKDELQTINRRLNELDRLIGSLYENFISGLLVQVPDEEILC